MIEIVSRAKDVVTKNRGQRLDDAKEAEEASEFKLLVAGGRDDNNRRPRRDT